MLTNLMYTSDIRPDGACKSSDRSPLACQFYCAIVPRRDFPSSETIYLSGKGTRRLKLFNMDGAQLSPDLKVIFRDEELMLTSWDFGRFLSEN